MGEPTIRKIIHVDMDAFFASVEQRDDPALRGRPVAVGGRLRGVVAAASYEARRFGVRSAMPSATARRLCAELVFVKPRFDVYRDVSRQIREIFLEYTPLVEPLSLDEAYLDVTTNLRNMPLASDIAREIRARILERTGLTASAGISYNKFLAKIASDHRKPNGQTVIPPEKGPAFVETLSVAKFHGIGPKTAEKMKGLGIHTGADLKAQSLDFLEQTFGKAGTWYHRIARGQDDRAVVPDRPRKSVGSETTFMEDLARPDEIERGVASVLDDVWSWCERTGTRGRTVTVKIKYADFQIVTRSRTLAAPVASREMLERTSVDLVRSIFPLEKRVRLLGVSLHNLEPDGAQATQPQMTLAF
ncbi:DNA polymerase IV [Reyranella sp.]|uniref:DNA polymerase IV n=1 Tax=Reyranella sp. TaxID=1929291 RepID=UPI003BAA7F88